MLQQRDVNELDDQSFKVRENRLRRMAQRQGLAVRKSRRRDPRAYDYGVYFVIDPDLNALRTSEHGMSLDEVEAYLGAE